MNLKSLLFHRQHKPWILCDISSFPPLFYYKRKLWNYVIFHPVHPCFTVSTSPENNVILHPFHLCFTVSASRECYQCNSATNSGHKSSKACKKDTFDTTVVPVLRVPQSEKECHVCFKRVGKNNLIKLKKKNGMAHNLYFYLLV